MGLEAIRDRIIADAQKEAAGIMARSEEEARLIIDEAEKEAKKIASLQNELAKAQAEKVVSQILSSAKLDARMRILKEKRNGIERIFEQAAKEFSAMKPSERMAVIEKLTSGLELPEGKYEIDCAECDMQHLDKKRLEEMSGMLDDRGTRVLIKRGNSVQIIGGFILRSESVDYDFSIDSLMRSKRGEIEKDIVKSLFSE